MKDKMKSKRSIVISNEVIWGLVIIACAISLRGTDAFHQIQLYLWGGAVASLAVNASLVPRKPKGE